MANIAKPLHRLDEKGKPFQWSAEHDIAFSELKRVLVTAPVLAYAYFKTTFTLGTGASAYGLVAVLSQEHS